MRHALAPILLICATAAPAAGAASTKISVSIRGSIERSLVRARPREGAALGAQVARLLGWRGDIIKDVHPRDRLSLLFDGTRLEPQLVAMHFRGAAITLTAHRFTGADGVARYYDSSGTLIEPVLAHSPTAYHQITEVVQRDPGKRRHMGIDLKAPTGVPVVLPFAARVYRINWANRASGNCVEIRYTEGPAKGNVARFLHLDTTSPALVAGDVYPAGTKVGTVGSTGRSSAPHLHYEIRTRRGVVLKPLDVHGSTVGSVEPRLRSSFDQIVSSNLARLGVAISTN